MLRFLGQFQADFQLKSGWIEPLLVGGYAPFSPLLVSFLVHGVLAVVCCLFHSMQILLPPPNDLQRQLRGGVEV